MSCSRGGGYEIRTREGFIPTRFPSVRPRPLGETSAEKDSGRHWHPHNQVQWCSPRAAAPCEPPQGRKAARISGLYRVHGGPFVPGRRWIRVSRWADRSCTLLRGGVSEWPKEHASKACDGLRRPRVQIPPPPLFIWRNGPTWHHGSHNFDLMGGCRAAGWPWGCRRHLHPGIRPASTHDHGAIACRLWSSSCGTCIPCV